MYLPCSVTNYDTLAARILGSCYRLSRCWLLPALVLSACVGGFAADGPNPSGSDAPRALVSRYCVACHNQKLQTAGIVLEGISFENVGAGANVWEKVLRKVRTGEMPPIGLPRPDGPTTAAFTSWLESALDRAAIAKPNPGRPAIHRLNRAEYSNAIRDLLALDIDPGSTLPVDDSGYGFDNIGDVLSVSPILLERYMSLARKISRLAVGDPAILPAVEQYPVPRNVAQGDRTGDDLPFGSRGGLAIHHHFPLDGEYSIKVRARIPANALRPNGLAPKLDVRLDGARLKVFEVVPKPDQIDEEGVFNLRIPVKAGTRNVAATFLKESAKFEGVLPPQANGRVPQVGLDYIEIGGPFKPTGPGNTPSREKIFACRPASSKDEEPCAKKILASLARRAYRRTVNELDLKPLLSFYETGRREGNFDSGIEMALRRMLVSPDFLFRIERDPVSVAAGGVYRINDFELASRLSFFLWSSIPDEQLLDLAASGKLKESGVLEQQVRRMLDDPRSEALVRNFAGQWLYLRNLAFAKPDPDFFPEFDENLRDAFQRETEMFFGTIVREDRSVVDLLDANYTFLNERLARHYGIPNVHGSNFRRVNLSDEERRGLLGQGSILTVTSYATRTSPVLRGKWILENLLGTPPPPPPANVPDLKDHGDDGVKLSLRQQMEKHRANATCAACHARLDPMGFALENFDGVGKWRTHDAKTEIDPSGALPDGTKFAGPVGLREVLLKHRDEFVAAMTSKLLTYALGRGLEYYDQPAVRQIAREAGHEDNRLSAIIMAVVKSPPFQMRRTREE